jgi:hypothetical protein
MRSLTLTLLASIALTLSGCGSSSASSTEPTTGNTTASSGSGAETSAEPAPVAHDTFRHDCERRRAAASCGGCVASYASEEDTALQMRGSCTRTENGAQVSCASECCMTCPQS